MDKIDCNREFGFVIDITEFNGYKKYLILKIIRKHKWVDIKCCKLVCK